MGLGTLRKCSCLQLSMMLKNSRQTCVTPLGCWRHATKADVNLHFQVFNNGCGQGTAGQVH